MLRRTPSVAYSGILLRLFPFNRLFLWAAAIGLAAGAAPEPWELQAAGNPEREESAVTTNFLAEALGVRFVNGSTSFLILDREGKQYVVDLQSQSIWENDAGVQLAAAELQQAPPAPAADSVSAGARVFQQNCSTCHGADGRGVRSMGTLDFTDPGVSARLTDQVILDAIRNGKAGTAMQAFAGRLPESEIREVASFVRALGFAAQTSLSANIYEPPDDFVYSLPTGKRTERRSLYVNFTHRFAYNPAFSGRALGHTLLGMDGFSLAAFGFRFGVTDKFSISAYRAPSLIGRPIEFMAAYHFVDEQDGHPLNASFRVSVDGKNSFRQDFTTNLEGIVSRSLSGRAQLYGVPTVSLQNRRLLSKPGALENPPQSLPGINSLSLGVGLAVDVRPTLALVAEVIPTLVNARDLGIHRPAYAFGIQKRVGGHAFTIGFSNGPGTVVSQRAGTRATFLGNPSADKPSGLFIGFNLMRRLR